MSSVEANPEVEFTKVRDNLLKTLNNLILDQNSATNLSNFVNSNTLLTDFDKINDYVKQIKKNIENDSIDINITNYLSSLDNKLKDLIPLKDSILSINNLENYRKAIDDLKNTTFSAKNELQVFFRIKDDFRKLSFEAISSSLAAVNRELNAYTRLRNISDNALTEGIYKNAVDKYKTLEDYYRNNFYTAICATILISLFMFVIKNWLVSKIGNVEFWVLKGSILLISITLISYFIKQSSHYQRLADQNYQTQVELQAFPSFMQSIPTDEAAAIRKELALKYFGREIDGSTHKDMSNLISDQMKNTTEMIKATTDVLKQK